MSGQKPIRVFQAGAIRAAIWENVIKRDGKDVTVHSVQIDRSFKDGDQFRSVCRYDMRDLWKVELVARKAAEFLALKGEAEGGEAADPPCAAEASR